MRSDFRYHLTDLGTLVIETNPDGIPFADDLPGILTQILQEFDPDKIKRVIFRNFVLQWDLVTFTVEYVPAVKLVKIAHLNEGDCQIAERLAIGLTPES